MSLKEIKAAYQQHHGSELVGIISAGVMAVVSFIPLLQTKELYQITVVSFFIAMMVGKLILFLWNLKVEGTPGQVRYQAWMMEITGLVQLALQGMVMIAVVYQLIQKTTVPLMGQYLVLAFAYGAYAFIKLGLSIYKGFFKHKQMNFYEETLYLIGWISSLYTFSLYTNYLLLALGTDSSNWARHVVIGILGFTDIVLALYMLIKAGSYLYRSYHQH